MVAAGAVPLFLQLLGSHHQNVCEQVDIYDFFFPSSLLHVFSTGVWDRFAKVFFFFRLLFKLKYQYHTSFLAWNSYYLDSTACKQENDGPLSCDMQRFCLEPVCFQWNTAPILKSSVVNSDPYEAESIFQIRNHHFRPDSRVNFTPAIIGNCGVLHWRKNSSGIFSARSRHMQMKFWKLKPQKVEEFCGNVRKFFLNIIIIKYSLGRYRYPVSTFWWRRTNV